MGFLKAGLISSSPSNQLQSFPLLNLPVEIRLQIYGLVFGQGETVLDAGEHAQISSFISGTAAPSSTAIGRSAQLLQTCKTVLYEARPTLYFNSVFHTIRQRFAGTLPSSFSDAHPGAKHMGHVIWQVECDILKQWNENDLHFDNADDWSSLQTLEVRCRLDAWQASYCDDQDGHVAFVTGREKVLTYCTWLLHAMKGARGPAFQMLSEDCRFNELGEVRMRLTSRRSAADPNVGGYTTSRS